MKWKSQMQGSLGNVVAGKGAGIIKSDVID